MRVFSYSPNNKNYKESKRKQKGNKNHKKKISRLKRGRVVSNISTPGFFQRLENANNGALRVLSFFGLMFVAFVFSYPLIGEVVSSSAASGQINSSYHEINQRNPHISDIPIEDRAQFVALPPLNTYQVQSGDTIFSICADLQIDCDNFINENKLEDLKLKPGKILRY